MLNRWDKLLHDKIHAKMLEQDPKDLLNNHRLKILDKINNDFKIEGDVADIGCGNAYFGIGLAKKFRNIKKIDCIEASKFAVEKIIPRNIQFHNVETVVKPIYGTFDNLGFEKYNIIFAMGALHHSSNLKKTLKSIAKALKPNGLLVAQEPAMPDDTTHEDYKFKYNIIEKRFGLEIKNGNRLDRFFRECEYKYCLKNKGFNICLSEKYSPESVNFSGTKFIKHCFKIYKIKKKISEILNLIFYKKNFLQDDKWKKEMNISTLKVKPKLFIARKSLCKHIFHDNNF